jgi:hypothetical protein
MSRTKAIEWLFWHHHRERWKRLYADPRGYGVYGTFLLEPPGADNCWLKWVLG